MIKLQALYKEFCIIFEYIMPNSPIYNTVCFIFCILECVCIFMTSSTSYVLLAVHLSFILVTNQLNAQILAL